MSLSATFQDQDWEASDTTGHAFLTLYSIFLVPFLPFEFVFRGKTSGTNKEINIGIMRRESA
ncbi:unnamed protein product [Sphenostylis stenocarpa]|uniref:Uncharacterized protein n=1 Tax=Sphenostylis stenocarpa TaxID=92480 RepID=A0AA87B916_9FABA|nr:unnamed protein product [Sphenostylis stenocarpa]